MLNIKNPYSTSELIERIISILRIKCLQFTSNMFQKATPSESISASLCIENTLYEFAQSISKSFLQGISSYVFSAIQEVIIKSLEGYREEQQLDISIVNRINQQLSKLKSSFEKMDFRLKQNIAGRQGFNNKSETTFFAQLIAAKIQRLNKEYAYIARFNEDMIFDVSINGWEECIINPMECINQLPIKQYQPHAQRQLQNEYQQKINHEHLLMKNGQQERINHSNRQINYQQKILEQRQYCQQQLKLKRPQIQEHNNDENRSSQNQQIKHIELLKCKNITQQLSKQKSQQQIVIKKSKKKQKIKQIEKNFVDEISNSYSIIETEQLKLITQISSKEVKKITKNSHIVEQWKKQKLEQYSKFDFIADEELRSKFFDQFCSCKIIFSQVNLRKIRNLIFRIRKRLLNNLLKKLKLQIKGNQFTVQKQFDSSINNSGILQKPFIVKQSFYSKKYEPCMLRYSSFNSQIELPLKKQIQIFLGKISPQKKKRLQYQFEDWWGCLQKFSWDFEEKCIMHKSKVKYLCLNETKLKKYLCAQCVYNKVDLKHQYHQIMCQRHKKIIKYKIRAQRQINGLIQSQDEQEEQQTFMCQQCLFFNHKKYALICSYHHQCISQVCIQYQCMQTAQFSICQKCQQINSKHGSHRKVKFDRESLMQQFGLENEIKIASFEKYLIKAKETLKLNPLQKIRISYAKNLIPTIRFVEAFAVYNNQKVSEWIDCFMNGGKKEDLMVLRGALRMKEESLNDSDKINYLEAFNFFVEGELQGMFKTIWETVLNSCKKINQLKNMSQKEVIAILDEKYKELIETESDDKVVISPIRLSDVNPIHHSRISKIRVLKNKEVQRDQELRKERRTKRGKFFKSFIRKKLEQKQIGPQQQREIHQLFCKEKYNYQGGLYLYLQKQNTLYKHQKIIQSLKEPFNRMNKQFKAKLRECLPWTIIVQSSQFSNLKVIEIQYNNKHQTWYSLDRENRYSIDGFELLNLIASNSQLEEVTIKGVQIQNLQKIGLSLNPNLDPQVVQNKEVKNKVKLFQPSKGLRLTLESVYLIYQFYPNFLCLLQNLSYIRRQFPYLSGITVMIEFDSKQWEDHIESLLQCLRGIKSLGLRIQRIKLAPFKQLLNGLASFTEISSIAFHGIKLNLEVNAADYSAMKKSLDDLFSSNTLTHLRLYNCNNFPSLPKINSLKSINFQNANFKEMFDLNQFVKSNLQLKSVYFKEMWKYQCEIEGKLFSQLQYASINYCKDICFRFISSLSPCKVKYLCLGNNQTSIDKNSLKLIFSNLANLTKLRLQKIDFGYKLLSAIPSNHLDQLHIWNNNEITDSDFQLIDNKWPYLREIQLFICPLITERVLSLCKFKGLMQISINKGVFSLQGQKYVRIRGIALYEL